LETLSNLTWAGVSLALCAAWFASRPGKRRDSLLPGAGVQAIAILVLTAVLLPVISLTDDLQATANPAETERVTRRADWQPSPGQPLHRLPIALAPPIAPGLPVPMPADGVLIAEAPVSQRTHGFSRAYTTRPPPTA
jgi:hypothetical protein